MYGRIIQDVPTVAGSVTAGYPHYLNTSDFCAFLVQDRTTIPGAGISGLLRVWPVAKTTTHVSIQRSADAIAAPGIDIVAVTPHSILDAGPIVPLDPLKTSTSVRTDALTRRGRAPSYRSLHHVRFSAATGFVDVTHNLGTDIVLAFIQPTTDSQPGAQPIPAVFWFDLSVGGVMRIHAAQPGVPPVPITADIDADVMIVTPVGPGGPIGHTIVQPPRSATPPFPVLLSPRPSYWMMNVTPKIPFPLGLTETHNLNGVALTALFCFRAVEGASNAVGIATRTPANPLQDINIQSAVATGTGVSVLVLRSHSICNLV